MPTVERHGDFEVYLDQVLGRGAMGIVVWGKQISLDRPVAIKILAPGADTDEQSKTRFQREARITAMLDPACSIVAVYGAWQAEGRYHLAMEYVDGASLKDLIKSGKPPLGASLEITDRVAIALKEAHGKNVLHRDLKPGNIMLTRSGGVKVVDFGIGKILGAKTALTVSGIVGTPYYMSPEQAKGQSADGRTDIYSLGCILFELTTGRPPFLGDSPMSVLYACTHEPVTPPRSLDPSIPEEIETIILKCLEKDPANRYQTAAELETHLAQLKVKIPVGGDWKTGEPHDDSTPGTTLVSWVRSAQTSQPLEKTLIVGTDTDRRERTPVFETDARSATPSRASIPPAPAPPPVTPVPPAPPPVPAATPSATGTTPPAPAAERKSGVLVFLLAGAGLALAGAGAAVLLLRQKEPSVPPPSVVVQTDDAALEAIRKRLEEEKTAADRKTQELLAEKRRADEAEAERRKLEAAEADRQKQAAEVKAKRQSAATALWDAALADRQAKRFEDAKQKLEEILKTYPDATQAAEARQMIPSLVRKGLRLESDPAGATVTLNGKPCATPTPVFLEDQPEGTYEIAFSRPGYAEARQKTAHRAGEDTIVRVALKPLRGVLVVRTGVAGARVILREASGNPLRTETAATDGVVRLGELPVGAYTLRVEGDRHLPLERPVDVKPETTVDVPLTLQELPADVVVTSDPPAGTVYLDGQEKGKTPLRLSQVPPGRHVLKVTHPESFDHEEQLVLRGQSNPPVEVRLQPRGRLLISAHPTEGTTVRVDGLGPDRVGVAERPLDGSELTLPVKPGRYAVVFKHAEAGTQSVETGVKAGEGVKVSADLWAAKGQELEVRGDTAGAIAAYEKSRAPSLAQTIKDRIRQQHEERQQQQQEMERKALGLKQDGEAALKAGRLPEAEAKLAEYCRAKPDDAEAAGWLAFVRGIPEGMTFTGRNAQGFEECLNRKDESTMVLIPAGEFIMGANDGERDEKPMRRVYLDAYLMDKLEISWGQFKAFCKEVSRPLPSAPAWGIQDDHPVVLETWDDAKAYCAWAGKRLPTEAEWEKGARGTDGRKYPWGNAWDPQKANTKRLDLDKTVPRGSYPPGASPWGLLDMAGNACEWCEDWFEPYSVQTELRNPKGPETGRYRVLRGGSWHETEDFARCSARFKKAPTAHDRIITFRGVRDLRK